MQLSHSRQSQFTRPSLNFLRTAFLPKQAAQARRRRSQQRWVQHRRGDGNEKNETCVYEEKGSARKMLKPSDAVETTTPGAWGCQCTSLMSCCPWWQNKSCAGTSLSRSASSPVGRSSSSSSTERSHSVTWSSAPEAAKHDSSVGCHSIEVMGPVCQLNAATGVGAGALVLLAGQDNVSLARTTL